MGRREGWAAQPRGPGRATYPLKMSRPQLRRRRPETQLAIDILPPPFGSIGEAISPRPGAYDTSLTPRTPPNPRLARSASRLGASSHTLLPSLMSRVGSGYGAVGHSGNFLPTCAQAAAPPAAGPDGYKAFGQGDLHQILSRSAIASGGSSVVRTSIPRPSILRIAGSWFAPHTEMRMPAARSEAQACASSNDSCTPISGNP